MAVAACHAQAGQVPQRPPLSSCHVWFNSTSGTFSVRMSLPFRAPGLTISYISASPLHLQNGGGISTGIGLHLTARTGRSASRSQPFKNDEAKTGPCNCLRLQKGRIMFVTGFRGTLQRTRVFSWATLALRIEACPISTPRQCGAVGE